MKVGTFGIFVVCAQAASGRDGKWLAVLRIDRQTPDLLRTDVVEVDKHVDGLMFDTEVQAVQAAFEAGLLRLHDWQHGDGATVGHSNAQAVPVGAQVRARMTSDDRLGGSRQANSHG